jgi:cytidylate kinase
MKRQPLSSCLRDHLDESQKKKGSGPFLVISAQYGCDDYEIGRMLAEKLNERDEQQPWKVHYKELLAQLAADMGLSEEVIERERFSKPSFFNNFLHGLKKDGIPDKLEINHNITRMIRAIAFEGYGIVIEQGCASSAVDVDNGLSIRIEAPRDWRIARICHKESLDAGAAKAKIEKIECQWAYSRAASDKQSQRQPAFNLIFDNSLFSKEIIVELVLKAMEEKNIIEKPAIKLKKIPE